MLVCKSDLGRVNITGYFNRVGQTTINIVNSINNFVSSTTELTGNGYDQIRQKMSFYADALNKTAKICFLFANNVTAANHKMISYMEDLDEIDTSLIGETETSLRAAKSELARLESYYEVTYTDKEGNTCSTWERVGSDAEIAYCKEVIAYLEHILEKMKGLPAEDDADFGMLDAISNDINSLNRAISGIDLLDFKITSETASIDTSNMCDEAKKILEEIMASWPEDLSEKEKLLVQTAFEYMGKGIKYSMEGRCTTKSDGSLAYLDCSSYIITVYKQLGLLEDPIGQYEDFVNPKRVDTGKFNSQELGLNYFEPISYNELRPSDICLFETGDGSRGGVHVFMYIGKDSSGNNTYIDCSSQFKGGYGSAGAQTPYFKAYKSDFGDIGIHKYQRSQVKAYYRYRWDN